MDALDQMQSPVTSSSTSSHNEGTAFRSPNPPWCIVSPSGASNITTPEVWRNYAEIKQQEQNFINALLGRVHQLEHQLEETRQQHEDTQKLLRDEIAITSLYAAQLQDVEDELSCSESDNLSSSAPDDQLTADGIDDTTTKESATDPEHIYVGDLAAYDPYDWVPPELGTPQSNSIASQRRVASAKRRVDELEYDMNELKKSLTDTQNRLKQVESEADLCNARAQDAETQNVALRSNSLGLERRAAAAEARAGEMQRSVSDLQEELLSTRAILQPKHLKGQVETSCSNVKDEPYDPMTSQLSHEQRAENAEALAEELQNSNVDMEKLLLATEAKLKIEQAKEPQSSSRIPEFQDQLRNLQAQQMGLEQRARTAERHGEELSNENRGLRKDRDEIRLEVETLRNKNHELKKKLSSAARSDSANIHKPNMVFSNPPGERHELQALFDRRPSPKSLEAIVKHEIIDTPRDALVRASNGIHKPQPAFKNYAPSEGIKPLNKIRRESDKPRMVLKNISNGAGEPQIDHGKVPRVPNGVDKSRATLEEMPGEGDKRPVGLERTLGEVHKPQIPSKRARPHDSLGTIGNHEVKKLDSEEPEVKRTTKDDRSSRVDQIRNGNYCTVYHLRGYCSSGDRCKKRHGERLTGHARNALWTVAHGDTNKFCNYFHLLGECPSGPNCYYKHGERLTGSDKHALAMVARQIPCVWKGNCKIKGCFYGH